MLGLKLLMNMDDRDQRKSMGMINSKIMLLFHESGEVNKNRVNRRYQLYL